MVVSETIDYRDKETDQSDELLSNGVLLGQLLQREIGVCALYWVLIKSHIGLITVCLTITDKVI